MEDTEPVDDPRPEQPEDTDGNMGTILLILAIAAVGGGAGPGISRFTAPSSNGPQKRLRGGLQGTSWMPLTISRTIRCQDEDEV